MEEAIAWILIIIALLVALPFVIKYILIGIYWFISVVAYLFFGLMDELTSAPFLPAAPWAMWLIWGAMIGAALAFWTVAPIYGLRKYRAWIVAAPFLLMTLIALARNVL